jgi:hypothetical protein
MLSFFLLVGILETTVKYLFLFPDEEKLLFPLDSYPYFNADDTIICEFSSRAAVEGSYYLNLMT